MGIVLTTVLSIRLPRTTVERLRKEAERAGLSIEGYILELITQDLDPHERAKEYIEVAKDLLKQAYGELEKGNVRQATEKVWGAAALAVKAYADWKEGKRLISHGELWSYKRKMEKELGGWVHDAWANATEMHVCFYEGWCSKEDVEKALKRVERLVSEVYKRIQV